MDITSTVQSALPYLYALVAIAAVYALVQIGLTAASTREKLDIVTSRVDPILEKADVTVDALNAELLRIDGIISDIEEVSGAAASATRAVESVANAPLEIATNLADRVRRIVMEHRRPSSVSTCEPTYVMVDRPNESRAEASNPLEAQHLEEVATPPTE